jgi:hypothetical protein
LQRLYRDFFIEQDRSRVHDFVGTCATHASTTKQGHCTRCISSDLSTFLVWADISLDFIEGLPKVHGKGIILTIVNHLSKYAHFITLVHPYMVSSIAWAFFIDIVHHHSFPLSIISDSDPIFIGHV